MIFYFTWKDFRIFIKKNSPARKSVSMNDIFDKKVDLVLYSKSIHTLLVCLDVCPFVSNKRQNGLTHRAQILCGTSPDPRESL